MPVTSTAVNACGVNIQLEDEMGLMADVSGSSNEANLDFSNTLGDYKVFGDRATYRLECGEDGSLELTVLFTRTQREAMDILNRWRKLRGRRRCVINVPENEPGAGRYEAYYRWEKINIPLKADEAKPIMVKATLKPDGYIDFQPAPGVA